MGARPRFPIGMRAEISARSLANWCKRKATTLFRFPDELGTPRIRDLDRTRPGGSAADPAGHLRHLGGRSEIHGGPNNRREAGNGTRSTADVLCLTSAFLEARRTPRALRPPCFAPSDRSERLRNLGAFPQVSRSSLFSRSAHNCLIPIGGARRVPVAALAGSGLASCVRERSMPGGRAWAGV
jgi:hypothetical protein